MFRIAVSSESPRPRAAILAIPAILLALLWSIAPQHEARAAFEEEDIPPGARFETGIGITGYSFRPIAKKPASLKGEQAGMAIFPGSRRQMPCLLFQSGKSSQPDSLIIDLNNNQNLTDDPVLPYPAPGADVKAELQTADGRKTQVRIKNNQRGFSLFPTRWYRGLVDAGGKKVMAALVDGDFDGLAAGTGPYAGDFLIVDLDGDGSLDKEALGDRAGTCGLQSRMIFDKEVWEVSLDAKTPDVALKRYEGPCGGLALDVQATASSPETPVRVLLTDRARRETFSVALSGEYTIPRLPAGSYACRIQIAPVVKGKQAPGAIVCESTSPAGILIEEGKTLDLTLPPPGKIELAVRQSERRLSVGKKLPAGPGMEYTSVEGLVSGKSPGGRSAPFVRIFAAGRQEPLAEGAMQYG